MARMRAEADHLAADGIVGVQLRMQMYAWGQHCLEFVATGTAVRHLAGQGTHRAPDGGAFTSDLSAQDFFRLLAAGAVPVAFVLGTCVVWGEHATEFLATGTAVRRLADEHKLPATSPKPTFTLGLDS